MYHKTSKMRETCGQYSESIEGWYHCTHKILINRCIYSVYVVPMHISWYQDTYLTHNKPLASVRTRLGPRSKMALFAIWVMRPEHFGRTRCHYNDVIMSAVVSQITSLPIVYSTVYSGTDERKHQTCASLAFVRGIHRWPDNSPHKGPVMRRKMFPFDGVTMVKIHSTLRGSNIWMSLQKQPLISLLPMTDFGRGHSFEWSTWNILTQQPDIYLYRPSILWHPYKFTSDVIFYEMY